MALLGAIFSRVVFARLQRQRALVAIIATVGFGIFLKEMAHIIYGPEPLMYPGPLGNATLKLFGISVGWQHLLILAVVVVLMIVQHFVLQRSMIGKVMLAVAVDRDTAALMGIPVQQVLAGTFAYSSVLAALAGILLAPLFFVTTEMGTLVGLKGFVAMIIGGFGSIPGAIVGGLLLGLTENLGAYWISSTYKDVIAFSAADVPRRATTGLAARAPRRQGMRPCEAGTVANVHTQHFNEHAPPSCCSSR